MGSSPLTRGKHDEVAVRGARRGLIPAHAGKTCKAGPPTGCSGAHPRSRGENFASTVPMVLAGGSSPLTRGKPIFIACNFHECGLIPAHAGKTHLDALTASVLGAHPRSRGENLSWLARLVSGQGSSPLTRGKLGMVREGMFAAGLIPAHAGKTRKNRRRMKRWPAHPRSRGENAQRPDRWERASGSSPLTRGKRPKQSTEFLVLGLIPAHAGKTEAVRRALQSSEAHPRSRGENGQRSAAYFAVQGSSPLTRGKPGGSVMGRVAEGLIPAHAGKTRIRVCCPGCGWAHPRSRGENVFAAPMMVLIWGSSPLTRGKLL